MKHQTPHPTPLDLDVDNNNIVPGVYTVGTTFSKHLTLNGAGTYIFQGASSITQATGGTMTLTGGACASNVYWYAGTGAMTFTGAGNIEGTIITNTAITFANSALTFKGRALAGSAVTMGGITITEPVTCAAAVDGVCGTAATTYAYTGSTNVFSTSAQLCSAGTVPATQTLAAAGGSSVTWTCTQQNGGTSATCTATRAASATLTLVKTIVAGPRVGTFTDFPLTATGPTIVTGVYGTADVLNQSVPAGVYALSETTQSNYTAEPWSCLKNDTLPAVTGASITLAAGDSAICTIQNTYIAPSSGGGISYNPVPPLIDLVKVPSPLALPNGPGPVTYTYTLRNIGLAPVVNITMVDDICNPVALISGDTNHNAMLELDEIWTYNCFKTLSETQTNTVVATGWANGVSATDIATATVVVGVPIVPPLIHVTKIPSPLALLAGGGMVTYTKNVTNPGTVALSNIQIADDKCSTVKYVSGDTNGDSKLDSTETWIYTCSANLTKTTTNTVTVSGQANGLTARDFAIATVVVAIPTLPNTGFGPEGKNFLWIIAVIVGILILILSSFVLILKKRTA